MSRITNILKKPVQFFNRLSLKKKIIFIVLAIIVLVILNQTIFKKKDTGYVTEPAKGATITQTVSETGNIDAGGAVSVTSPSTGFIENLAVDNGQFVKKGDVLFNVKSTATVQEQQAAYANYLAAQSALNTANSSANTLRAAMYSAWDDFYNLATNSTYEDDNGNPKTDNRSAATFQESQDTWLAAEKKYKDQQTAIAQAQASVSSTWLLYQQTQNAEVKATADGVVANLSITDGDNIKATGDVLVITPTSDSQYVKVAINEIDIPKIKVDQKSEITIDAIDDATFNGTVARVDSIGTNTQGVITYNVYVKLNKTDPRIKSEMTANVTIETNRIENALSVPNSAVKLYQGGRAVQILENGKPKYIPVRIGIRGSERTQILSGIKEGQVVITGAKNAVVQRQSSFGF